MSDRRRPATAPIRQVLLAAVLIVAVGIGVLPLSGVITRATPVLADSMLHELPTPKEERSQAYVVDQDGRVVSATEVTAGNSHSFIRHDSAMSDLGTLGGATRRVTANAAGFAVGWAAVSDGTEQAVVWRDGVLEELGGRYTADVSERNRPALWLPTAMATPATLAHGAETRTAFATPVAGVTPISSATQSGKSFVWDQVDVTVELGDEGSFHITERSRVAFSGGPFRTGYREIPLARIEEIDSIRVGAVEGDHLRPFRYVAPSDFTASTPNTYTSREIGPNVRIDWSFPETTSQSRTFQIEYDAHGALRVYDDVETPSQQISWSGVDRALTQTAPVNTASLTFILPRPVDPGETVIQGPGSERPEDHTADGQTWVWTATDLGPGESLEAGLQFPPLVRAKKPTWQDASDRQEQQDSDAPAAATPVDATPVSPATPHTSTSPVTIPMATPATLAATPPCRDVMQNDFNSKTRELLADCTTDRPIFVPEEWVFDGGGHTIFAVDPDDGRLTGGVVMATEASGIVRNVTIDGSGLTAPCLEDRGQTAITGVILRGASGEVSGVTVRNLVRALPTTTEPRLVTGESVRESCGTGIAVLGRNASVVVNENVIENVGYVGVLVEIGQASISHNTIDRAADTGVLALLGAHVRISPSNQIRNGFIGIQLEGEGTGGRVAENTIETMTQAGITITFGAHASVAGNTLRGPSLNGIAIEGATTEATIENNQLDEPGEVGIKVLQASAEVRGNTVSGGDFGIGIGDGGTAQVVDNTVNRPQNAGIYVLHEGTTATIGGNTVADAASAGIWVEQGAQATITGNTVTDATSNGITAAAGAAVEISGENIVRGSERGIEVSGAGTTATVTGNRVEDSGVVGITINRGAAARDVSGNTVTGGQFGIVTLGAGTAATVTDNSVSGLESTGFTVESGANADLRRNHVTRANVGIYVDGSGSTAELSENRIEETTTAGIVLQTGSQTIASSNSLLLPGADGIRINGTGTTATITDTFVSGANETGIEVGGGASATISDGNRVSGGTWGIAVIDAGTTAAVSGNTVWGFANQGISVHFGARATIEDNAISDGTTGVLVKDRSTAIVDGNTIRNADNAGVVFERSAATATAGTSVTTEEEIEIASHDIYFEPKDVTIPTDTDVTIMLPNQGVIPHNFSIDALGISVDLAPGAIEEVVINAPAGEYAYYCDVPGHKEAGMVGTLIVSADAATPVATPLARSPVATPAATAQPDAAIHRNTIEGGQFGIVVKGAGSPITVEGNHVRSVENTGISIEDQAMADLAGNTVADASTGINIAGPGTRSTLTGNRVTDTTERGIHVHLGADALLRKNTVTRAGTSGIVVGGSGTAATLEGNVVSNASEIGIAVESAATATIDKGNFVSGGKWGISILNSGTSAEVRGNRVRNVTNQGISVLYGAQATVDGNTVEGGASGIYVRYPNSRAVITGNFVSTGDEGIYVWEGATAEIAGNEVIGGKWGIAVVYGGRAALVENQITGSASGIYLRGGGTIATVTGNTVSDSVSNGIYIFGGVTAERIEGNIVTGGVTGILVAREGTTAVVEANDISGASHEGIALRSGASAEIRRNHVKSIGDPVSGSGISVTGSHTTATVEENTLSDIGGTGILFNQGGKGTISGNTLSEVTNTGIRIIDADTKVTVTGNTVRDARAIGIEARAGALTITGNTVVNAPQAGIQLGPDANVEVTGNTITGPGEQDVDHDAPYGIQVLRGASGAIIDNWITNHGNANPEGTACGIVVDAEAPYVVISENRFPDPGNEVDMCDARPRLQPTALRSTTIPVTATPVMATPVAVASTVTAASPEATPVSTATPIVDLRQGTDPHASFTCPSPTSGACSR